MRNRVRKRQQREPTIALINIVFLMLVFFMVAGTLAQPLDPSLRLVRTGDLQGRAPPDALVVHADGRLTYRGKGQASAAFFVMSLAEDRRDVVRLVPDRALPAQDLVSLTRALRDAGAQKVMLIAERALQ
ncbi:Biopolymer transport protein ExbD/TolR (plasmid) [Sulfitobacter sp. THAF37]|uniref:ExbD/TolR family protein n=1 Tax=Sulfitobacter sp. THAF37 TaxID=2587855 RepID=UPI001267BB49|nr:biopolymer transporter ExbD [Sulfitobacter sp. THAF37]QFT60900.1 Biopolymer transport protein ExbD/TolR [Sulfitobacter sp. THAF37]